MNIQQKPFALFIFGPTAVGKNDFALEIAQHLPVEIINGDIGQFYTPLTIGTSKPDWRNESVVHHLFDIIDEPKNFTVCDYRAILIKTVQDVWIRGKLPIIVGGSGFYIKSIFFPPSKNSQENDCNVVDEKFSDATASQLWEQLNEIDSKRADQVDKNDLYRIKRALIIWKKTGQKPSVFVPSYNPPFHFMVLNLDRDTGELYNRINTRTGQMLGEGWIQEVEKLLNTEWEPFLYKKKLIGYDILLDYCSGEKRNASDSISKKDAVELIQRYTRNYAKRQKTFWKSLKKQLNREIAANSKKSYYGATASVNLTLLDRPLYINQVSKKLRVYLKKV